MMAEFEKASRSAGLMEAGRLPSAPLTMPEQVLTRSRRIVLFRPLISWLAWR